MGRLLSDQLYEARPGLLLHKCPGCQRNHSFPVLRLDGSPDRWRWNGSATSPTFEPSMVVAWPEVWDEGELLLAGGKCHYFLRNGQLEYLSDCTHDLAGKVVPLPAWVGAGY